MREKRTDLMLRLFYLKKDAWALCKLKRIPPLSLSRTLTVNREIKAKVVIHRSMSANYDDVVVEGSQAGEQQIGGPVAEYEE